MRVIRIADCPPVPWKNGAGATREVWKLADAAGEVLVRISIAEITGDQRFSVFPGIDRIILQLDGPPMFLTIDGTACALKPHHPKAFPGEAVVQCALQGQSPAHDLNIMCRRGLWQSKMKVIDLAQGDTFTATSEVSVLLALSPSRLSQHDLAPWDAVVLEKGQSITAQTANLCVRLDAVSVAASKPST